MLEQHDHGEAAHQEQGHAWLGDCGGGLNGRC